MLDSGRVKLAFTLENNNHGGLYTGRQRTQCGHRRRQLRLL